LALKTGISDGLSHHIAVLLFNETIVVFTVGAASCELDAVVNTPVKELMVDELAAVVTVDAEQRERQDLPGTGDLFFDPAMSD
jgi:hypothetical protein